MPDPMSTFAIPAQVKSLLVCDERPPARQALAGLLTRGSPSLVVDAVADGFAVVDAFTARPADLVLIGVHRGNSTGLQAVDLLIGVHPAAPVLAFGSPCDSALLIDAVTHGVRGVMLWDIYHQSRAVPHFAHRSADPTRTSRCEAGTALSQRELQILGGMSQGHSNKQIGSALFLSEDTIKTHARRMFAKLGARDRAHAVALGMRTGLVT